LQVGFAGKALVSPIYDTPEEVAGQVLAHYLSTGQLWEKIRMQAGAYGVHANLNSLEKLFVMCTYRDPDPVNSLAVFMDAIKHEGKHKLDEESLEKAIIGTYAKLTRPKTPSQRGFTDFERLVSGVSDEKRARNRSILLDLTAKDLRGVAKQLASDDFTNTYASCIVTGLADAEKTAERFGAELKMLPV
jgi:Zn-dependent M16 (insulinase) family peptidase